MFVGNFLEADAIATPYHVTPSIFKACLEKLQQNASRRSDVCWPLTVKVPEKMASTENIETENIEDNLVTYLKNILKHQIIPIDVTNLKTLIKEAPKKLKLFDYVQDKYPDSHFLEFLMKYPDSFNLNPDGTVTIAGPNYCIFPYSNSTSNSMEMCDEVDGLNREEYVSGDSDSDEESVPDEKEILLNPGKEVTLELEKEFNSLNVEKSRQLDSASSSCSESSDDYFSSELVQTSDSLCSSSMSSDSSSEN